MQPESGAVNVNHFVTTVLVTHLLFSVQALLGQLPVCNGKIWSRCLPLYTPAHVTPHTLPRDLPTTLSGEYLNAWDAVFRANAKWTTFRSRNFNNMRLQLCAFDPHAQLFLPPVLFGADRDTAVPLCPSPARPET